jgi:hypothetical protein
MSGYHNYSKSNNALEAERAGRYPATILARKLGVRPGAIKALLRATEWHHTSKYYNSTEYYFEDEALEILAELRAWREPKKDVIVFDGASGSYLEWSGTRNHPKAKKVEFGPCRVTQKDDWFTIELASGKHVRKRKSTRGFMLRDAAGKFLTCIF